MPSTVTPVEIVSLASVASPGGFGGYFWTYGGYETGGPLSVYAVGGSSTPIQQCRFVADAYLFPMPGVLGVLQYGVSSVDLAALDPSATHTQVPSTAPTTRFSLPTMQVTGRWPMRREFASTDGAYGSPYLPSGNLNTYSVPGLA